MSDPMRRAAVLIAVVAVATVAALVATPAPADRFTSSSAFACGVERWTVKTLKDRPRLLRARTTTVSYLVSRPAPRVLPSARLPFEYHVFTVTAAVTLVRPELDKDMHLVLRSGGRQMIAEA